MKLFHINHDKLKLLIFFAGFYTDYNCFVEFDNNNQDILFVYDYSDLDFSQLRHFDFSPYVEINLISYSYGVFASNIIAGENIYPELNKKIAISGTIYPIDENFGIKPKIYDLMLNSFDEKVLSNFKQRMEKDSNGIIKNAERTIENLKSELISIKNYVQNNKIKKYIDFDSVIITKKDKIIPYTNQINYWSWHKNIIELDSGHFPFFGFQNFDEILEL